MAASDPAFPVARWPEPKPNFQTVASLPDTIAWLFDLASGQWSWCKNGRCKYVTLKIDTRHGVHRLEDRDGNSITLDELRWQYSEDCPRPPSADALLSASGEASE